MIFVSSSGEPEVALRFEEADPPLHRRRMDEELHPSPTDDPRVLVERSISRWSTVDTSR